MPLILTPKTKPTTYTPSSDSMGVGSDVSQQYTPKTEREDPFMESMEMTHHDAKWHRIKMDAASRMAEIMRCPAPSTEAEVNALLAEAFRNHTYAQAAAMVSASSSWHQACNELIKN